MADLFNSPKCRCESCSPDAPGKTYTRLHLHECEVRSLVALPSNAERRTYLELVEKRRGGNAAHRLRDAVWKAIRAVT